MENKVYCHNCGNYGHIFKNCHYPIISLGIICFIKEKNIFKFILIRRKYTLGYIDFIRGKYSLNKQSILKLINIMTLEEKSNLIKYDLKYLWDDLWNKNKNKYIPEYEKSNIKFNMLKNNGIENNLTLDNIIELSNTKYEYPEWGFPKGKREQDETDLECAIREFTEETNLTPDKYKLLNLKPVVENFIGSNKIKYRHIYFIAELSNQCIIEISEDNIFQQTEISSIKLMDYDEIITKIRPYNKEKINVIESVIDVLNYLENKKS